MSKNIVETQPSCNEPEYGSLTADQAKKRILAAVNVIPGYQQVPLFNATRRILDQTIVSEINVPAHKNAAVDGYAINSENLPASGHITEIPIIGTALAGKPFAKSLTQNQSVRITTGAKMPEGADTVIMLEHVESDRQCIRIDDRHKPGQNVRQAGEDIKRGHTALEPGKQLTPADIGLISSMGIGEIKVKRKPRIAIFSTGDEIHDYGDIPPTGGIFDSNRYILTSALKSSAVDIVDLGIIADNKDALREALSAHADNVDAIITSGGVSVGEADYVKEVLANLGTVEFWKVAIKPGRPLAFGRINDSVLFGLPGNPVAVMVTFYQFVMPALKKLMGIKNPPIIPTFKARATERLRKKKGRTEYQRGIIEKDDRDEWSVRTTGKQGAGILTSMSLANALIILPHESGSVEPGDFVTVQPLAGLSL